MSRYVRTGETGIAYLLDEEQISPETVAPVSKSVGHHILVIDRSGSMYGDMEAAKATINQALAVESMMDDSVLTTLVSFSSSGDVRVHWERVALSDVVDTTKPYQREVASIRATALTSISTGLLRGLKAAKPGETTGITLFTDGWANDPSPAQETAALRRFVTEAKSIAGVFLNCVGYRSWCDWRMMGEMSDALHGKTVQAQSFKDVLKVMKDTQALVSAPQAARGHRVVEGPGLLVAVGDGEVYSGERKILVPKSFGGKVMRVTRVIDGAKRPPNDAFAVPREETGVWAGLAFAELSKGRVRAAKEVLFASGNKTLWERHATAGTPSALQALREDLVSATANNNNFDLGRNVRPRFSLTALGRTLNALPEHSVALDLDAFLAGYRRRTVKRTNLSAAELKGKGRTYVTGMEISTTEATVNLKTERRATVWLNGVEQLEMAGVDISDLAEHRMYTVLGCGETTVERLPLQALNKAAYDALKEFLPSGATVPDFSPGVALNLRMKDFRLEGDGDITPKSVGDAVNKLIEAKALAKMGASMLDKIAASPYSKEQADALRTLSLTPSLYYSPQTTEDLGGCADKTEAVAKGVIDTYTRYKISFGTLAVPDASKLPSGNAWLKKSAAARAKPTEENRLMAAAQNALANRDVREAALASKATVDALFEETLNTVIFSLGCLGALPEELENDFTAYTGEEFTKAFGIKADDDAMYYTDGNTVIRLSPEVAYYSV